MSGAGRPQTVLVTGAAGFIGSALCARLLAAGHTVVGYDNLSRGRRELLPDRVRLVEGDIRDSGRLAETMAASRPEVVVHLAAMHFIPDCIARPQETTDVNVEGTRRVLDSCRSRSVRRVVFASSGAVYASSSGACVEDTTPLHPLEVYGESKLMGEDIAGRFHRETGIATAVLRIFNAIGRNETNPHVIPHIFESLQTSNAVRLGNMAPRRDYIDTRDVADAIIAVAGGPEGLTTVNVGTGSAYSVDDIIQRLERILGRRITVVQDASRVRASERMLLLADLAKIRAAVGWQPRVSLDDALRDLVVFYGLQTAPSPAV
jgi:UDP-glucose 4-epimerase